MPSTYFTVLTNSGQAKVANALALGTAVSLSQMAVGDGNGNPTTPTANQTALVRERFRASINQLDVDPTNPNYFYADLVIPTEEGGWTVHEVGLFATDGTLFAVANFPATYKPVLEEGSGRELVVRVYIQVSNVAAVNLMIDPTIVLASRQWVSENYSIAAQIPGGLTGQILRKQSNEDGDVEWFDPASGFAVFVEVIEEHQTLSTGQTIVDLATVTTDGLAVYIDGLRTFAFTATTATRITLDSSYPDDTPIDFVQNDPTAETQDIDLRVNQTIEDAGLTLNPVDDTQLTTAITKLIRDNFKLTDHHGLHVDFFSVASFTIAPGFCFDDTKTELMQVTSAITVSITTSGKNGRDAGSELSNTKYQPWLIKNPTTGEVAGLLSLSTSSPTLPSGFTIKRRLPGCIRNNSSGDFMPWTLLGWDAEAIWQYEVDQGDPGSTTGPTNIVNSGSTSVGAWTDADPTGFIPSYALAGVYRCSLQNNGNSARLAQFRSKGVSHGGVGFHAHPGSSTGDNTISQFLTIPTGVSGFIQYSGGPNIVVNVSGFIARW